MFTVKYGGKSGKTYRLVESKDHFVVRTLSRNPLGKVPLSPATREILCGFERVAQFAEAGVEVFRAKEPRRAVRLRDAARARLKRERYVQFAGRVNARRAVELAAPAQPNQVATKTAKQDVAIPDLGTAKLSVVVADTGILKKVRIKVDLEHTYVGDLIVSVKPPAALGLGSIVLHNRIGGGTHNLKTTYDSINAPGLAALAGKKPKGTWTLVVQDKEAQDAGTLRSFAVEMTF